MDDRTQLVKDKRLCFNCLKPGSPMHDSSCYLSKGCVIEGCNGKHHSLLHRETLNSKREVTEEELKDN